MGWFKNNTDSDMPDGQLGVLGNDLQNSQFISWTGQSTGEVGVYIKNASSGATAYTTNPCTDNNTWNHIAWVHESSNQFKIYVNGDFIETLTIDNTKFPTDIANREIILCKNDSTWSSLIKLTVNAVNKKDILKIYEAEKVLFQENAKCTLEGTSSRVYNVCVDEDTKEIHATSGSSGRSTFSGLRRIKSTTAETYKISASNGLLVEG